MRRLGRKDALVSFIVPASFYLILAYTIGYVFWPYFYFVKNETLITIAFIGMWRYTLLIVNYIRAAIYGLYSYPRMKKEIEKLSLEEKFPKHIYFMIPSYKEEAWVSVEVFQSIFADINNIPCTATLIVSTGSDKDDQIINSIYNTHPIKDKIDLIFQRQSNGKRIAMGHGLRVIARHYNNHDIDNNSVTVFMDGDSYIPLFTLEKCIPIFSKYKDIGAVTTNEVAYVNTKSKWYHDWFNLKFGQRHVLFQSQSLSRKVLTLTGRFSIFRTSAVVTEDFIDMIENDIVVDSNYGKFRFLMGDDKSSWYNLMKNGWNMLYIPDAEVYSLESRDGKFLEVSRSLPYRWYGNTLRNNKRARALKNQPLFIRYLFWDQIFLMWTSLVGIIGAILLATFVNFVYLPIYIAWILIVRVFQMFVITLTGHNVSIRTVPLMLYSQWIGATIKIKAFYHLSDQKWSKSGTEVQTSDGNVAPLKYKFAKYFSVYRMYFTISVFLFLLMTFNNNLLMFPSFKLLASHSPQKLSYLKAIVNDNKDDSLLLNKLIKEVDDGTTIILPEGILDINNPIVINRSNITILGNKTVLVSHLHNNENAVIFVEGQRGKKIGSTEESLYQKISFQIKTDYEIASNDLLLIQQNNDITYIKDHMKSQKWYSKFPHLRTEISEVAKYKNSFVTLKYLVLSEIDAKADIYLLKPIKNVHIKNIQIDSSKKSFPYNHKYKNIDEKQYIDGVKFLYAKSCSIEDIKIFNSGSNPLVFERCYSCSGKNITIDGAINKGKNGNGYLRFNKTFHTNLDGISVKNIRHIVFQWASAYNNINNLYTEVDVNFHGGSSHHNSVSNVVFNVDKKKHKWGDVFYTPRDAKWAPPDYDTNIIIGKSDNFKNLKQKQ